MYIVAMEMECKNCGCRHISHITQLLGGAGTWDKLPAGQFVLVPDMCVCLQNLWGSTTLSP
jgi:hypothetical protein